MSALMGQGVHDGKGLVAGSATARGVPRNLPNAGAAYSLSAVAKSVGVALTTPDPPA
jgi:hypothetical protein